MTFRLLPWAGLVGLGVALGAPATSHAAARAGHAHGANSRTGRSTPAVAELVRAARRNDRAALERLAARFGVARLGEAVAASDAAVAQAALAAVPLVRGGVLLAGVVAERLYAADAALASTAARTLGVLLAEDAPGTLATWEVPPDVVARACGGLRALATRADASVTARLAALDALASTRAACDGSAELAALVLHDSVHAVRRAAALLLRPADAASAPALLAGVTDPDPVISAAAVATVRPRRRGRVATPGRRRRRKRRGRRARAGRRALDRARGRRPDARLPGGRRHTRRPRRPRQAALEPAFARAGRRPRARGRRCPEDRMSDLASAPPSAAPEPAAPRVRIGRGARRVSALTMLSRLLGLVREQIFALTLGAGATSDAFLAAFRIPNLLRDLFAEGALSTAFVPTYVATLRNQSRAAAFALANRVMSTLTIYLGVVAGLAMLFPEPVVRLVASGFSPEKAALCATLVRIMAPFLAAISLAVVAMGALNAEERYTAPALASSMFNLVAILGGVVVYVVGPSPRAAVMTWAALTLVGGLAQLAVQLPPLRALGFRPRLTPDLLLRDPGTRRIAALMAPATLGVAAVQINVVINSSFASLVSDGAISWLSYAFRLMQLPIGVFGVAVGTTTLTHLSRDAARSDWPALAGTLRRGLRMVLFLTVPSMVGLGLLGVPIIRLIYEHGRFGPRATFETARALSGYAVGLAAYSAVKVVAPAFYALGRTRVPLLGSLLAVAANVAWNIATFRRLGHFGLALGTSIAATVNLAVLVTAFQLEVKNLLTRDFFAALARIALASAVMAAAVWLTTTRLEPLAGHGLALRVLKCFVPVCTGAAVYFLTARALRLEEAKTLFRRR